MGFMKNKLSISSLGVKLPFYLALFCIILSTANAFIGYRVFKQLFERQYKDVTEQIAETALSYIDADRIVGYAMKPEPDDEWRETDHKLDVLTVTAQLAYIYVTIPSSDYKSRIYIYDTVHPDVQGGKKYELGRTNSLEKYDEERINELKRVMNEGESEIHFVYNKTGGHVTTSIPVKDSYGKCVAIMSVVKPMHEVRDFKVQYRNTVLISSAGITALFVCIFVLMLIFRVVRPLRLITEETAHFAEHGGQIEVGNLAGVRGRDELGVLARSVEKMSDDMNQYIADLTHTTAEKERLSAELDVATQIQANMLPRIFPPYENHPEIELYASMSPAKEVGGDFYDFFIVDDDHFAIVVGDVSGKGVPAALFMVIAKTLLKNVIMQGKSPAEVFGIVNNQLCEGNDAGLFVTCWMGLLTLSTGELVFANAGHTSPVIRRDKKAEFLVSKPNLMLAGMEGMAYQEHSVMMKGGDRLFVYTDGITEATNAQNELYGENRLLAALNCAKVESSKEILSEIRADIDKFVGDAPQFDDITMLEFSLKK